MKIEKRGYSRSPWRLIDASGAEVYFPQRFAHPDIGETVASMPVCGDTKEKCTAEVLRILERLLRRVD